MHPNIPPGPPGVLNHGYPPQGPPGQYYPQNPQMMQHQAAPLNHMPMNPQNMQNGMYHPAGPGPYPAGPPQGAPVPPPNAHMMHWMNPEYPSYPNSPAPSYAPSMMSHMSHSSLQDDRHSTMSMHSDMRINDGFQRPSSQISCSENVDPRTQPLMNLHDLLTNFLNPAVRADVIRSLDVACNEARAKKIMLPCAQLLPLLQKALENFNLSDVSKLTRPIIYFIGNANKQELSQILLRDKENTNSFAVLLAKNAVTTLELIYALYQVLSMGEKNPDLGRNIPVLDSLMNKLLTMDNLHHIHYYRYALQCLSILVKDKGSKAKPYILSWKSKDSEHSDVCGLIDIIFKEIIPKVTTLHTFQCLPGTSKSPTSVGIDILNDTYELLGYFLAPTERAEKEQANEVATKILQNGRLLKLLESMVWYGRQIPAKKNIPLRIIKLLFNLASYSQFSTCAAEIDDNTTRGIMTLSVMILERCTTPYGTPNAPVNIIIPCWRYLLAFIYRLTLNNERNKMLFSEQRGFRVLGFGIVKCASEIGQLRERVKHQQKMETIKMEVRNLNEALDTAIIIMINLLFIKTMQVEIAKDRDLALGEPHFLEAILRVYDGKFDRIIDESLVKRLPKLIVKLIDVTHAYQTKEFILGSLLGIAQMNRTSPTILNGNVNLIQILLLEAKEQFETLFKLTAQQEPEKKKIEIEVVRILGCIICLSKFEQGYPEVNQGVLHFARACQIHSHFLRFIERKQEDVEFCRELLRFGNEICSMDPDSAQVWLADSNTLEVLVNNADAEIAKYAQKILDKLHVGDNDPMAANLAYGFAQY